jgi:hypothetical protein
VPITAQPPVPDTGVPSCCDLGAAGAGPANVIAEAGEVVSVLEASVLVGAVEALVGLLNVVVGSLGVVVVGSLAVVVASSLPGP